MKNLPYVKLSIIIIVVFAVLRLIFAATHTVSGDACWHLSAARLIAEENKIPLFEGIGRLEPFWAPPLFHFIAAFFYKIFLPIDIDFADLGMKLVSPIFGTLTVILLFLISKRMFNEKIAFYSMIFVNFVPIFLDYSVLSYVESITAFFLVLSVYLILNKNYFFASLSLGLALLSKYHAVLIYPMIVYLIYAINKGNTKKMLEKIAIVSVVLILISSVWFLRNFLLLDNPVWPFFNNIFHGTMKGNLFGEISLGPIFSLGSYIRAYLEFFGIPNGSLDLVISYATPLIKSLFWLWLIGTFIFIYPFFKGLFKRQGKEKSYFVSSINVLLASYLFMFFVFLLLVGWFGSRLLLPIVPFMAIVWALGLDKIKPKKYFIFIILFIGIGFLIATGLKFATASNEWGKYSGDFEWAKLNTEKDAVFFGNGQCVAYNINRIVINHKDILDFNKIDYIWVNNEWKIDFQMNQESLGIIQNSEGLKPVYNNTNTGTIIYKVIQ